MIDTTESAAGLTSALSMLPSRRDANEGLSTTGTERTSATRIGHGASSETVPQLMDALIQMMHTRHMMRDDLLEVLEHGIAALELTEDEFDFGRNMIQRARQYAGQCKFQAAHRCIWILLERVVHNDPNFQELKPSIIEGSE